MTVLITLTIAGEDSGPFNLYSDVNGFISAFETNVSKESLLIGYSSSLVPDYTTIIKVISTGVCKNYVDLSLMTTTTTTTTIIPLYSYTIEGIWEVDDPAHPEGGYINYFDADGILTNVNTIWITDSFNIIAQSIDTHLGVIITPIV